MELTTLKIHFREFILKNSIKFNEDKKVKEVTFIKGCYLPMDALLKIKVPFVVTVNENENLKLTLSEKKEVLRNTKSKEEFIEKNEYWNKLADFHKAEFMKIMKHVKDIGFSFENVKIPMTNILSFNGIDKIQRESIDALIDKIYFGADITIKKAFVYCTKEDQLGIFLKLSMNESY